MKILLVDDETTIRNMMRKMLQSRGLQVFDAATGREALALSEQHSIDVLVSDMVMEDMDGSTLASSLEQRNPALPVLFVSGYPMDIETERRRHGRCAFLAKPFQASDLLNAISALSAQAGDRHAV